MKPFLRTALLLLAFYVHSSIHSQTCSGTTTFTANQGAFDDGSGTASYSNSLNCFYLIQPISGATIILDFISFSTESCCDFLSVYDGSTTAAPLLGTYSGTALPPSVTSSGNSLLLRFSTDSSVLSSGFSVEYTACDDLPAPVITADGPTSICDGSAINIVLTSSSPSNNLWSTGETTQSITVNDIGVYNVTVTENNCQYFSSSTVVSTAIPPLALYADYTSACAGGQVALTATSEILNDNMDQTAVNNWNIVGGAYSTSCGSVSGQALYFNGSSIRTATTTSLNLTGQTVVEFYLKIASGSSPCEDADVGEEVVLEYSTNNGATFNLVNTYNTTGSYNNFTLVSEILPAQAVGNVLVRWRQLLNSGTSTDNWALDNVSIFAPSPNLTFQWSPSTGLSADNISNPVATINGDITYTCTMSDGTCSVVDSIDINLTTPPVTTISANGLTTFCEGNSVFLTASGGINWNWSNGDTTLASLITTSGNYSVEADYGAGCISSSNVIAVEVHPFPDAQIFLPADTAICNGNQVELSIVNVPGNIYQWQVGGLDIPTATGTIFITANAGIYTIEVTSPEGCVITSAGQVVSNLDPVFNITADSYEICPGGSVQLTSNSQSLFDNFDPINSSNWIITGGVTSNACGSVSGNALYFDGTTRNVRTNALNLTSGAIVNFFLKFGTGTSPCEAADAGENVVLEYSINNGLNYQIINTYTPAAYPVFTSITEILPAAAQTANTILRWRQIDFSGTGTDNWSIDDVSIFSASDTYSYLWTPASTLSSDTIADPIATPDQETTYFLTVNNGNCSATDSVTISLVSSGIATITSTLGNQICSDETTTLTATAGVGYLWSNGQQTQSIDVNTQGQYDVTVDFGFGCSSISQPFVLGVNQSPLTTLSTPVTEICNQQPVTISAATGAGYSYQWLNNGIPISGATLPTYTTTTAGLFSAQIVDNNNCDATTDEQAVTNADPQFVVVAASDEVCPGGTTVISALSQLDLLEENFDVAAGPDWTIVGGTISASCGSVSTNALYFNGASTRTATLQNLNIPFGGTVSFYLKIGTGSSPCEAADPGEEVVLEYSINGTTYNLLNTFNVALYSTFTLVSVDLPLAAWSANTRLRWRQLSNSGTSTDNWAIDDVQITGVGSAASNYQWSPSTGLTNTTGSSTTATINSDITYTVTGTAGNCSTSQSITIAVGQAPETLISYDTNLSFCEGESVTLYVTDGESFLWNNGEITSSIVVTEPGTFSVDVDYGFGCNAASDVVSTDVLPNPVAEILTKSIPFLCNGNPAELSCSSFTGLDYQWMLNGQNIASSNNPVFNATVPGVYTVMTSTVDGCSSTSGEFILEDITPTSFISASDTIVCTGDQIDLIATSVQLNENFDPVNSSDWIITGGLASNICGSVSGNAMYFDGATVRNIRTNSINLFGVQSVSFYVYLSTGTGACEMVDSGEGVVFEYSTDGGSTFTQINYYDPADLLNDIMITEALPAAAQTSNVILRWSQPSFSGSGTDNWWIDEIQIGGTAGNYTYSWMPANIMTDPTSDQTSANITESVTVSLESTYNGCTTSTSLDLTIDEFTVLAAVNDASCSTCCDGQILTNIAGGEAPFNYIWSPITPSGQGATAAIDVCPGQYIITVTDANGCSDATIANVGYPNQVSENLTGALLSLFPNPANDVIAVRIENCNQNLVLHVYASNGALILTDKLFLGTTRREYDIASLSNGIYNFVFANENGEQVSLRIVKQ